MMDSDAYNDRTMVMRPAAAPPAAYTSGSTANPWRTVFKWVSGVIFTVAVIAFLGGLTIYRANNPARAQDTIDALVAPLLENPELTASISEFDPELLEYLGSPDFAESVYNDPEDLLQKIENLPEVSYNTDKTVNSTLEAVGVGVTLLGGPAHRALGLLLMFVGTVMLASGVGLVLLSWRLGRLANPGICIAIASWAAFVTAYFTRSNLPDIVINNADTS